MFKGIADHEASLANLNKEWREREMDNMSIGNTYIYTVYKGTFIHWREIPL